MGEAGAAIAGAVDIAEDTVAVAGIATAGDLCYVLSASHIPYAAAQNLPDRVRMTCFGAGKLGYIPPGDRPRCGICGSVRDLPCP